jgi:hypothetical protein
LSGETAQRPLRERPPLNAETTEAAAKKFEWISRRDLRSLGANRRILLTVLTAYAAANLLVGVWLALAQPARASDLWMISEWCRGWLLNGQELYLDSHATTDYPPNAIVMLAPLALVPKAWLVPLSAAITLTVSPLLAYLVVRSTCPRARPAAALVPVLLFLCWGGVRTLLEFSRLSMALAFLATIHADRPVASGVSLGLALAKPHIAGPMMLWTIFTRRTRLAAVAVTVVAVLFVLYCARARVGPVGVVDGYARILLSFYSGTEALVGRTSLRPWWIALAGGQALGEILWAVAAALLLIVPCAIAMRDRTVADVRAAAAPALFCLWSLLTIYHIGNNLILLLPAFAFLLLSDDPATVWWRIGLASAIQIAMMLDIPVHLPSRVPDHGPLFLLVRDVDRIVVLVTYISVALLWRREFPSPRSPGS